MPFKKGKPKTGGRAKGVVNKTTTPIKEKFQQLLDGYSIEKMIKDLESVPPSERIKLVTGIAEFVTPKLQRSQIQAEVETKEVQTFTMFGRKIVF
jgi:hypothetical protein